MNTRGRPKQYDPETALRSAMQVFWQQGFSATSLDDLSAAMAMNRPSIYNAFGTKQNIYRQALSAFCGQLDLGIKTCLDENASFDQGLRQFFESALDLYCANNPPQGCLMICTAPAESLNDPDIKKDLRDLLNRVDRAFEKRIKRAIKDGELADGVDPKLLAMSLQSTLHTVAIRARADESKRQLKKFVHYAIDRLPWIQ